VIQINIRTNIVDFSVSNVNGEDSKFIDCKDSFPVTVFNQFFLDTGDSAIGDESPFTIILSPFLSTKDARHLTLVKKLMIVSFNF